jgi:hypothetical protein
MRAGRAEVQAVALHRNDFRTLLHAPRALAIE